MGNCNMWASVAKNRENFDFLVKMFPYWTNPPSDFYNIKRGVGCRRSVPSRQISPMPLLKCGLTIPPQIAEIGNFWYKFARKGYTPEAIL